MKDEILIHNTKFWVDQNIIYCKIYSDFDDNFSDDNIGDMFYEAISILSDGRCMPVIFNFREINSLLSIKLFKLLSSNSQIKKLILSKAFLVKNNRLKYCLSFYVMLSNSVIPNSVFKEDDLAIQFSDNKSMFFNALSSQ